MYNPRGERASNIIMRDVAEPRVVVEIVFMTRSFKSKPSTVHEAFGDETVIVNLDTGSYYSAQGTSSVIWRLVGNGALESNILRQLRSEFAGDRDEMERALGTFLDQLLEEALVTCVTVGEGGNTPGASENPAPDKVFSVPLLQKYTDMEEMLLLDPIHEVDEQGWPSTRKSPD